MRRSWALFAAFAGVGLALAALQPISNADTFGHLAQGRGIAEDGLPELDPFSFWRAAPQPWVNYEWLSDWLTWLVFCAAGWNGLIAFTMLLVGGSGAALVWLSARRGGPSAAWLTSLLLVVAIPAVRFRLSARPHLVALPFSVLYLGLLTSERAFADRRNTTRTIALLAGAHVLWTNLHGSHLLGLAITGAATLAAWPDRKRAATLAGTTAILACASCISPYGPAIAVDAALHVFDPAYRAVVSEWQALTTLGAAPPLIHWLVQCAVIALIAPRALRGGNATRTWLAVSVVLALAALRSLRFVEEFLILSAPLIAIVIARAATQRVDAAMRPAVVAGSMMLVAATSGAEVHLDGSEVQPLSTGLELRFVPGEAADHIEHELDRARVLGSMPSTWYLLFAAPSARVAIDGRVPFYGPAHVQAAIDAMGTPGALMPFVERFGVDTVIVQHTAPDEAAALQTLANGDRFERTWIDGSYAVYVRRDVAERHQMDQSRFDALPLGYDAAAILGASDSEADAIRDDLANLGTGPDAHAFASFVRAMLRLRPLTRQGGWAGYRPPVTDDERERVEAAHRELAATRERIGRVPVVAAHSALVAALACRLEEARLLLEEARLDGEVRETIFAEAEVDLREGNRDAVRALLDAARRVPGARDDAWLNAIEHGLTATVHCPP